MRGERDFVRPDGGSRRGNGGVLGCGLERCWPGGARLVADERAAWDIVGVAEHEDRPCAPPLARLKLVSNGLAVALEILDHDDRMLGLPVQRSASRGSDGFELLSDTWIGWRLEPAAAHTCSTYRRAMRPASPGA